MTHISLLSPIIFDSMFFVIRNVRTKNSKSLSRNRHNPELWPFDVIAKVTWINKTSQRIVWRLRVMWYIEVLLVSQHWFKVNDLDWNVNVERLRMQARSSRSYCWGDVWKRTSKTFQDKLKRNARRIKQTCKGKQRKYSRHFYLNWVPTLPLTRTRVVAHHSISCLMRLDQICFNKQQLTINENKKKMSAKTSFEKFVSSDARIGKVCLCL